MDPYLLWFRIARFLLRASQNTKDKKDCDEFSATSSPGKNHKKSLFNQGEKRQKLENTYKASGKNLPKEKSTWTRSKRCSTARHGSQQTRSEGSKSV